MRFRDDDEAIAAANELGDGCAGITMTSRGYSLRIGPELKNHGVAGRSDGLASWTKGEKSEVEVKTPTPSPEPEEVKAPDAPKKAKKAKKVVMKVAEPEPEPEPESEDDDDEMEVTQITIDGNDYFLNDSTGDIYDPETQEIVGKSENGKHTLFE